MCQPPFTGGAKHIFAYMTLRPELQTDDPILLVRDWLSLANSTEQNDPTAAALATATVDCIPNVRMVLVKGIDNSGFRFYTNEDSKKGHELRENPRAALCFHWKSLRRQIRVQGSVRNLPAEVTNEYFHSRGRRSQIGAAVSQQSRPLQSREVLEQAVAAFELQHRDAEIPKPAFWQGYELRPEAIEFWIDGADRLHDRLMFTRTPEGWQKALLYP